MKTIWQWASFCAISLALVLLPATSQAQTTPTPQGKFVIDPAVPTVISPAAQGSEFFVLNQDLSLLTHSTVDSSLHGTCAAPGGFSATSPTPRTFLNDTQNAYFTAQSSTNANAAVSGFSFVSTGLCQAINGPAIAGGTPTYAFSSNDPYHARYYVLSGFNGNGSDTLTVEVNLNYAASGGNYVTHLKTVTLDTGAQYTSLVTDTTAGAIGPSLTAITELKTATSPGNLWIYNQSSGAAYKILGPGGVPLPAIGSFLIPPQTNGGGALLVLINQDNLTSANLSNPPLDTTPFTIIDLGQLIQTFSIETTGGTITLPYVTQISATTPYFAMLGAAYNPVNRMVYAVVGGGSLTGVTGSVIRYDPFHPGSPSETVVADLSNIPFTFGSYPQLALSAASGTLQILTSNPTNLYSVGILGTGNLAVAVDGSVFPDSNFKPTSIVANPLLGETYIASSGGQVDILKNSTTKPRATFTINGPDIATTTQTYQLQATALYPTADSDLSAAPVTITATPAAPGTPFTVAAGSFANFGLNPSSLLINFPALGVYTLVASIPATTNYPAITSNPVNVTVASNFIAGVYPTTLSITAPANSTTTAVNVLVNLGGSTYAPTGHIDVKDGTGAVVGTTYFNGGPLVQPTTVAVTLAQGLNTLTAKYSGDAQNAPTTSPALQVSVGTTVTPILALTVQTSAFVGNSVSGNVTFRSTTTNVPTGLVTIFGLPNGNTTPISLTTITAAQAFTGAGANFNFTAPAAGTYEVYASYAGDTNYASTTTGQQSVVTHPIPVNTTTVLTGSTTQSPGVPFTVNIKLSAGTTSATPTGNVVVTAVLNSTGASTNLASIPAAQAFATGGSPAQVVIATAGIYTVTANYSGDANFNGSSNSLAFSVGGTTIGTTVGLSGSTTQAAGSAFALTVRLATQSTSASTPSGNVVITAVPTGGGATTTLATVTAAQALAAGGYATQVTLPAAGSYTVTARYAGDTNFGSSSGSLLITAAATGTTLGLSGSTTQTAGTAFPLTVRLASQGTSSATPSGNVVLTAVPSGGGATLTLATVTAAQALASGGYAAQVTLSTAGSFTVTANYAGDTNFASSSGSLVVTVASSRDVTTLGVSAPSNVLTGDSFITTITLKATGPNTKPITGVVVLKALGVINSYELGTVNASDALASGSVQIKNSIPYSDTYTLQASYLGDPNYKDSVGNADITVSQLTTSLAISAATNQVPGVPFPVTVRLTAQANPTKTPTGNVLIRTYEGTTQTTLATVPVAQAMASGGYQAQITLPASASYTITASYAGDLSFNYSTANLVINANSSASLTLRSTVAAPIVNVPFILCVDLASKTATATPTGNFTIGAVDPILSPITYPPVSAASSLANKACTPAFSVSRTGTYVFSATYPGDSNYPALQASLNLNVQPQPTTLTLVGAATAVAGSPYQVVTTLASPNTAPDGSFTLSATLSGSTTAAVTVSIDAKTAVTGTTSFLTFPTAGTYTVTASYPGSDVTAASAAPSLTVVVAPPPPTDFTMTLDDPSVGTALGALSQTSPKNTATITLTTKGTGPGPVTLSAAGDFPGAVVFRDASTMKLITTATPTITGTKIIVEYDKTAPTAALQRLDIGQHPGPFSFAGGLLGLACLAFRRSKIRQMRGLYVLSAVVFIVFAARVLSGCATPVTYQVKLTATPVTAIPAAPPQSVLIDVNASRN